MSESPLKEARELDDLQFTKRLHHLLEEQRNGEMAIDADLTKRGLYRSGVRGTAITKSHAQTMRELIDGTIAARRELATRFPGVGSPAELEALRAKLQKWLDGFAKPHVPEGAPPEIVQRAMAPGRAEEAHRLKAHLNSEIEILKREFSLNMHRKPDPAPTVSVNTAGGPAIVNLGEIRGDVQQVVGTLNAAGQVELASILDRLASGIEALADLGSKRSILLERVRFIARQSVEPEQNREASVVRAVFESLRARLQDFGNLAQVLSLAGPAIAQHFGMKWPF